MNPSRWTLLTRVALALAAVGLLPLGLLAWLLIDLNRDAMRNQILQSQVVLVEAVADRVAHELALDLALAETAATNVALAPHPLAPEVRGLLYGLLRARPSIEAAVVLSSQGGEVVRAQRIDPDPETDELLAAAGDGPFVIASTAAGPRWLRVETAIPEQRGTVRLLVQGEPLGRVFDSGAFGAEVAISLLDPEGRVLAGSPLDLGEMPAVFVEQALSAALTGSGRFSTAAGEEVLAAYQPVEGAPWVVLSRQSAASADFIAADMLRRFSVALALALVLIGVLAAAAAVSVVRPLRQLVRVQRRLAGLSGTPGGGSEVDQLKASFAALERSLRERQEVEKVFLGRYQVTGMLGEGAMGMVFRAWDPKLQRPLALKTIHLAEGLGPEHRSEHASRLISEAVTAAHFNHPNIVAVYDAEDAEEAAFIAMELIEGATLETRLWQRQALTPGEVAHLGAAVARALAAAHEAGVVHHDVKPANILLGRDGSIKVTDFGISQILSDMVRGEDAIFGTPGYLPPETLETQEYTEKSDLFALGAVLYHCLTGRRPFAGKSFREVLFQTLEAEVTPPHRIDPRIPEELSRLVVSLLEKEPGRRPGDAAGVAARLERLADRLGARWRPELSDETSPTRKATDANPPSRLLRPADRRPRGERRGGSGTGRS